MKKAVLIRSSKKPFRCVFDFKKEQRALISILEILKDLEIDLNKPENKELFYSDDYLQGKSKNKYEDIENISDFVYYFNNEDYSINLFFGESKIIFVVESKEDKQEEISSVIFKYADFGGD